MPRVCGLFEVTGVGAERMPSPGESMQKKMGLAKLATLAKDTWTKSEDLIKNSKRR